MSSHLHPSSATRRRTGSSTAPAVLADVAALTAGAVPPAVSAALIAVRRRRIEPVALSVLISMALGLIATVIGGSPRPCWPAAPGSARRGGYGLSPRCGGSVRSASP